ncbi:MAG: hypothetical protein IK066_05970, partial [Kiritimatiellae bacterium]|nr:hypothetical protein [Kiritimatiellia bacterium]
GRVFAGAGLKAACIGGGDRGAAADVAIRGGTVTFSNCVWYMAIGYGTDESGGPQGGSATITGGSVNCTDESSVRPAAFNAKGDKVWPVLFEGFPPGCPVSPLDIGDANSGEIDYGTTDLFVSDAGEFVLWLPNGSYSFKAYGLSYTAVVDGSATNAVPADPGVIPVGVMVDGIDVGTLAGDGWTYDPDSAELLLSGDGLVLSGWNDKGRANVVVGTNISLTVSNLTLAATNHAPAISVPAGCTLSLALAGQNTLCGSPYQAAIEVPDGAFLEIRGDGSLSAAGGDSSAGIGGSSSIQCGEIVISGNVTVTATGDSGGAGIGGGNGRSGNSCRIEGGTVEATGGYSGAGIGGGGQADGFANLEISGGTVTARGGKSGAGIGGGFNGGGGSFLLLDGSVTAVGGQYGAGIGGGEDGMGGSIGISGGTVTATGGESSAGIGGGSRGHGGAIAIDGGNVTATGGKFAAGIGGGDSDGDGGMDITSGGNIAIRGGIVTATGGENAAGIGSGNWGMCGVIGIFGGSVHPKAGDGRVDIGGNFFDPGGTNGVTLAGGTVFSTADMVYPTPTNTLGAAVYPVAVTNLTPGAPVALGGLPDYYGTKDIYADTEGKVVLWLPEGVDPSGNAQVFFANGYEYAVPFAGGVNATPGKAPAATQGGALSLERLEIVDFSLDADTGILTLRVAAEPATWTHGFADTLSLARTDTLSPSSAFSHLPSPSPSLSPDGTVCFSLPLDPTPPTAFFSIFAPK